MSKEKMLNIQEASEQLGVTINTLYAWVHLRKIEYIKMGRLLKFKQSTIDRFIEEHTVPLITRRREKI